MRQLEDVIVKGIALTGKPANRRPFLLKKSQESAVSDSSEPSIQAAPSEILDAVRAVSLAKGEDADTSDALEAVAHLVYGNPNLTLQDLMAVAKAAQVQDVAKASKKKDEPDAEAEEEGYDEESEQDPSDDEDDGDDDEDEEDGEAEDKKDKKMPAFLKEKLKKAEWNEGDHPRDDNGRFGSGGSGDSNEKAKSAAGEAKSEKSAGAHYRAQSAHEKASSDARDLANKMSHNSVEKLGYLAASKAHAMAAEKHGIAARQTSEGHEDAKSSRSAAIRASGTADRKTDIYDRRSRTEKSHQSADTSANQGGPMEAETAEVAISKSQYDSIREDLAKSEARIAAFEYKEAVALEKSANEAKYSDLTLDHDKLAKSMLALRKSAPEQVEALEQSLSAANEQVRVSKASGASIFARKSSDGFAAPVAASADKFRAMVEEHVAKSGGSRTQAIAAIAKTKDGLAAYKEMNGAN